ncbi:hypothetical protein F2Q69_00034765 [Brassica cretica]|uniref:Uncharacterized protein n=1 Tax=Brassica cretica TaxID=69181 RepID=A0A8S9SF57_BRACR|nr:hypothetical protein F2Q69_00034765 [Brassica cretica]
MFSISDPVIKGVVDLVEAEIVSQSQPLSDDGDSTGASTNLSLLQINEMVEKAVPKRKGVFLVGLARRASSYPASSSQAPYADPMILEELHDKDEWIGAWRSRTPLSFLRMPLSVRRMPLSLLSWHPRRNSTPR